MDYDTIVLETEERMEKALEVLNDKFRGMRTGRATPALVDNVRVDYYGSPTPLKQIANISAPDPDMIVIKAFDHGSLGEIEKAIQKADLGINPTNDGKLIRIKIPPLSQERRNQLAHQAKGTAEDTRVALRNIRRDANKHADGLAKTLPEDDLKKLKDEIQNLLKSYEEKVDRGLDAKTKELTNF